MMPIFFAPKFALRSATTDSTRGSCAQMPCRQQNGRMTACKGPGHRADLFRGEAVPDEKGNEPARHAEHLMDCAKHYGLSTDEQTPVRTSHTLYKKLQTR